jgi:cyclopropane fatty-acyl-phospholipid synthase-like methyltransferase
MTDSALYSSSFFKGQVNGSLRSARTVMPFFIEKLRPKSVLDVGCGLGAWGATCANLGVSRVLGIDGSYVDTDKILLAKESFVAVDLTSPHSFSLPEQFDLVICLEVAEHLPEQGSDDFISFLCESGRNVLFSAAVPAQGGTGHINEQWQSYWVKKFAANDYAPDFSARTRFWNNEEVEYWYRQNMILFSEARVDLSKEETNPIDVIHPRLYIAKSNALHQALRNRDNRS